MHTYVVIRLSYFFRFAWIYESQMKIAVMSGDTEHQHK